MFDGPGLDGLGVTTKISFVKRPQKDCKSWSTPANLFDAEFHNTYWRKCNCDFYPEWWVRWKAPEGFINFYASGKPESLQRMFDKVNAFIKDKEDQWTKLKAGAKGK